LKKHRMGVAECNYRKKQMKKQIRVGGSKINRDRVWGDPEKKEQRSSGTLRGKGKKKEA